MSGMGFVKAGVLAVAFGVGSVTSAIAACTAETAVSFASAAPGDAAGGIGTTDASSGIGAAAPDTAPAAAASDPVAKKKGGFGRMLRDKVLAPAVGVATGVAAGYGCKALGLGSTTECAAVGVAAGAGGYFLGRKLVKKLAENDQAKLLEATSKVLQDGTSACLNFPDSKILADISATGAVTYQEQQVAIGAAGGNILAPNSSLTVETQDFMAPRQMALYAGPDTEWGQTGAIPAKTPVEVIGSVTDKDWLLIGVRNTEEKRLAIGYAAKGSFVPVGSRDDTMANEAPGDIKVISFKALLPCRTVKVKLTDTSNDEFEESEQQQCTGPDGSVIQGEKTA